MILTVAQYTEALASPDGRWRTVWRIVPVADETGGPRFVVQGHGVVDFEVAVDGERRVLRCPLIWDEGVARRMESLVRRDRGLGGRFFDEWRLLKGEVVVFGDDGRAHEVDVLARVGPRGEPLADFLEKAAARGDTDTMDAAAESLDELVAWARRMEREGIALNRLVASPRGELSLTAFSAVDGLDDVRRYMDRMINLNPEETADTEEIPPGHSPADWEEYTWDEYWGVATVMNEGCWGVIDADGKHLTPECYDWLGEYSEGLLLAEKEGRCGFIDLSGREAIPLVYDEASSFFEGRALVTLGGESFFIDHRGERV